jgi:nitronate monooxygenase
MPTLETALTRLLAIEHPIMLAPMGSVAGGKLASAVTNAGGLGMIGSGQADVTTIRKELSEAGNARVGIVSSPGRSNGILRLSTWPSTPDLQP